MNRLAVMTIAGSDSGAGAGIQADLKTFSALGCYGTSVITAVTAQNTKKVYSIMPVEPSIVGDQLKAILDDFSIAAVKTGMLYSKAIVEVLLHNIKGISNLVVDPVMLSTSGMPLLSDNAIEYIIDNLFPMTKLITPNLYEMQVIVGRTLLSHSDIELACKELFNKIATSILVKGGHFEGDACDILFDGNNFNYFNTKRIDNIKTHGTGCTLSSAIVCYLAMGYSLINSISNAKDYVTNGIIHSYPVGNGYTPLNHFWSRDI